MKFESMDDAVAWLQSNGWRKNDFGVWLKGDRQAEVTRAFGGITVDTFPAWRY